MVFKFKPKSGTMRGTFQRVRGWVGNEKEQRKRFDEFLIKYSFPRLPIITAMKR